MEENAKDYIIKVNNLAYTYPDGTEALKEINLNILRGEKLAIMGANGSGKSTFFLNLNGIKKPSNGAIFLEGKPIKYDKKGLLSLRKSLGIIFQDPDNQLFAASVKQEISFGPYNLGWSEDKVKTKVEDVIEELNITEFEQKPTHFLSGGQKKRVTVADILVMEPSIIILDEPAAGLDPKHIDLLDKLIEELSNRGITIIVSTHDVSRALEWADRVVLFRDGRIIKDGNPVNVFRSREILKKTNLKKPPVLEMYDNLIENDIIREADCVPRTMEALEIVISKNKI